MVRVSRDAYHAYACLACKKSKCSCGRRFRLLRSGEAERADRSTAAERRRVRDGRVREGGRRDALARVLERTTPDALLAAYDHQLPGLLELLAERGIDIPVVGCDGLDLPGLPSPRPVVVAPRRRCGELVAERLIAAITGGGKVRSAALPAVFRH